MRLTSHVRFCRRAEGGDSLRLASGLARAQEAQLALIDLDARYIIAQIRKQHACDQANIASADDT